jgi:flagellar basal body rod protein FlgB
MDGIAAISSGLDVTARSAQLTASNVANVQSKDFRAQSLRQHEQAQGGVAADGVARSQQPRVPGGSNVDLANEATDRMKQSQTYGADLKFMKVQEKVLGTALDLNA